jgi:hypothetical protein
MPPWEYQRVEVNTERKVLSTARERAGQDLDEVCAELGEQGWELISVTPWRSGAIFLFFKRPKPTP